MNSAKRRRKLPKPQRMCVFCGGPGLTYEHVWADWLKRYLPMDMTKHDTLSATAFPTHSNYRTKMYSGDPHRRRLRVVCRDCNGGWMAKLQECAKPHLLPLLAGQAIALSSEAQSTIAAWAAMAMMVAEFYDPTKVAIPQADREHLRTTQRPPDYWRIWIGKYLRGEWQGHWVHHVLPIYPEKDIPESRADGTPRPNTQTSVFVAGQLYIYAVSAETKIFDDWITLGEEGDLLRLIWPPGEGTILWPIGAMTDEEAARLASTFFNRVEQIGRRLFLGLSEG